MEVILKNVDISCEKRNESENTSSMILIEIAEVQCDICFWKIFAQLVLLESNYTEFEFVWLLFFELWKNNNKSASRGDGKAAGRMT